MAEKGRKRNKTEENGTKRKPCFIDAVLLQHQGNAQRSRTAKARIRLADFRLRPTTDNTDMMTTNIHRPNIDKFQYATIATKKHADKAEKCRGLDILTSKNKTFEGMTVIFLSRPAHNSGFLYKFASAMNRARRILTWIRRIRHCRGFGIQSPTDYRFVRNVINENYPYHAYE